MNIINFTAPTSGSWLVQLISWLVGICGSVALGVVLFTVILKLITLPFDYVSRASMRKNSLKMEEMRPELEKLQRQYADNKQLYNQKMLALYKKNGYSMWGACLPTILTLVIFIVAISAFTDYSRFQNQTYFYNMSNSYNNVVYSGFDIDENEEYVYRNENGKFIVKFDKIVNGSTENIHLTDKNGNTFTLTYSSIFNKNENEKNFYDFALYTTNSYMQYKCSYTVDSNQKITILNENYFVREDVLEEGILASEENNFLFITTTVNGEVRNNVSFKEAKTLLDDQSNPIWTAEKFVKEIAQTKSAETYRREQQSFFWVKNIWATDSPMSHPIESDWNSFKNTHGYNGADIKEGYGELIAKLDYEKNAPNGYFILIALTALSSLVLQIVTTNASKAQMELQTVDGQGMQTQKMMKWIMPIMMAFFAFMYTAAFSLYIVVNSILSIGLTYGINLIVDTKFKKEQKAQKPQEIRGRVYTPKEEVKEEKKEKKVKKNKDDKFAHENGGDFLTGKVKKKK